MLRVRATAKDGDTPSAKPLKYSIRSVVTKKRGQDMLAYFYAATAIQIDEATGNVNLLQSINDLVNNEVEEMIVEVVAQDGKLSAVETATIRLIP